MPLINEVTILLQTPSKHYKKRILLQSNRFPLYSKAVVVCACYSFFLWDPFVFRSLQFEWIVIWMVRAINRISPFSIWFKDFPPRIQNGTTTVLREAVYSCCMPEAHRNRKHSSKWPFDLFSVGYVRASNQNPTIMEFWLARCDYEFENRPLLSGRENANDALA